MSLRAALFTNEYEPLGALTGQSRDELIAEQRNHDGRDWWLAWDGDRVVGLMQPWLRPDGKQALFFGPCAPGAHALLAAQIPGSVVTVLDTAEQAALDELANAGFTTVRFEDRYSIPVRPFDAPVPPGLRIISAADTELERLMALDCTLRDDVPGSAGWQPDATWFREETYDSPYFDPSTYLVALDGEKYVGLVRIWNGPQPLPRLGLIGLLPAYRRRGLARALISPAFSALLARGATQTTAEADRSNVPSTTLLASLGGTVTGSDVELCRD
jgi:ribosomal protein S18 acetylase RimI-like enzyme